MSNPTPDNARICRLSETGLIRVTGEDAAAFLQGQFGNDLTKVDVDHHQLNCYSNPKGRLLSIFRAFTDGEQYYLSMPEEIIAPTLSRLKMFVLMAKVQLEDVSDSCAGLGVSGAASRALLSEQLGSLPENQGEAVQLDGVSILRVPGIELRYELYGKSEPMNALYQQLCQHIPPANADDWALGNIQSGIPTIYTATREEFVAQMVNLQLIDGLSFKKGCFPGQEIVARMHYLGKLKRRMYLATIAGEAPPAPGTDVFSTDATAGKIVDARKVSEYPTHALMVLNIASAEAGELRVGSNDGPLIELLPLPYSFESTD